MYDKYTALRCSHPAASAFFRRTGKGRRSQYRHFRLSRLQMTTRPMLERGFYQACEDLQPERVCVVHAGNGRYPIAAGGEAVNMRKLAREFMVTGS
jgi:hypothetical protein